MKKRKVKVIVIKYCRAKSKMIFSDMENTWSNITNVINPNYVDEKILNVTLRNN